ncbi:MAG: LSU ribosomal protein L36p @ LSU ribosomal protein L36p, zinc-dependent, partial [uncultured Rubrobacteraceae bacterium]
EGTGEREADVREVQGHTPPGCGEGNLPEPPAQAEAGI